jgi:CheY-like chemotaxis protein
MSEPAAFILVVDDATTYDDFITAQAVPQYQVHFARTIQEAYWKYVEHPEWYKLVLLDFNLDGNSPKSNFDGIDLALILDTFAKNFAAKNPDIKKPWIVAFTSASDDLTECFFDLPLSAPLVDVIRKQEPSSVIKQFESLFQALSVDDPGRFLSQSRKPQRSLKQNIELDDVKLREFCPTYRDGGKANFLKIASRIGKALLSGYRDITFSALAPGYSGSEILSVVARRSKDDSSDFRTFVIKLCKDKTVASQNLSKEVDNYILHAKNIQKHVPLLIGPFKIPSWQFIAYEFISFLGAGIRTFADHLHSVFKSKSPYQSFETESFRHYSYIFWTILITNIIC